MQSLVSGKNLSNHDVIIPALDCKDMLYFHGGFIFLMIYMFNILIFTDIELHKLADTIIQIKINVENFTFFHIAFLIFLLIKNYIP